MTNMKAMNDKALTFVTGGDKGDKDIEKNCGVKLYHVGETVEVYMSIFHIRTRRGTIIAESRVDCATEHSSSTYYKYKVEFSGGDVLWVTADDIQR